jgi:hypothetical protein
MSGVKGRSGRKSWDKEIESKEIWQLSTRTLKHALLSDGITLQKKAEIAVSIFNKMTPNYNINENSGEFVFKVTQVDLDEMIKLIQGDRSCCVRN